MNEAYIIVFDDGDALCIPMSHDKDCEGAVCTMYGKSIALFDSRKDARTAINISKCYARLLKTQGKPFNEDFLPPASKHVKVLRCVAG